MRGWVVALGALLAAGCIDEPVPVHGLPVTDLAPFTTCPVVNETVWPCKPAGDNPVYVEVAAMPPAGWRCISYADQRFAAQPDKAFPFPDWYTYFGPAIGGDEAPGTFQLGFLYDAGNDTEVVRGAVQVLSQDDALTYIWEGPARGFVRLPSPIEQPAVLVEGVLYPGPGAVKGLHMHESLPDPNNDVEGAAGAEFWSRGAWTPPASSRAIGPDPEWQWNLVRVVEASGQRLFPPAINHDPLGHGDQRRLQGSLHWGQYRHGSLNATLAGVHTSSLTPYAEFYFEAKNIHDAALTSAIDFLCRCPDVHLVSVDGALCLLGQVPSRLVSERGVVEAAWVD